MEVLYRGLFVVAAVPFMLLGGWYISRGLPVLFRGLRIAVGSPSTVEELSTESTGFADVCGEVIPTGQPIVAPFSATKCVLCEYEITQRDDSDEFVVAVDQDTTPFTLESAGEQIRVDPAGMSLRGPTETVVEVGPQEELPTAIQERLRGVNGEVPPQFDSANTSYPRLYTERRIEASKEVRVVGRYDAETGAVRALDESSCDDPDPQTVSQVTPVGRGGKSGYYIRNGLLVVLFGSGFLLISGIVAVSAVFAPIY